MERFKIRFKRAKDKINWGNPTQIQKHIVDPSPCLDCGHCIPRGEHDFQCLGEICIARDRIKQMPEGWTIATREGKRCKDFIIGTQTKIGDFE